MIDEDILEFPTGKGLISKLKLGNKDKFIDLVSSIRNSIHNNGLYELTTIDVTNPN